MGTRTDALEHDSISQPKKLSPVKAATKKPKPVPAKEPSDKQQALLAKRTALGVPPSEPWLSVHNPLLFVGDQDEDD